MKYLIKKYFSGYCTYEVDAENEDKAYELVRGLPIDYYEVSSTLEKWEECDEIEPIKDN